MAGGREMVIVSVVLMEGCSLGVTCYYLLLPYQTVEQTVKSQSDANTPAKRAPARSRNRSDRSNSRSTFPSIRHSPLPSPGNTWHARDRSSSRDRPHPPGADDLDRGSARESAAGRRS